MAETNYAFIKDGNVTNVAVFDEPTEELLNHFKTEFNLDHIILATEKTAIGGTWDGTRFILTKPFPSWILNEAGDWEAPIAMPVNEGKFYLWNEETVSWDEFDITAPTE